MSVLWHLVSGLASLSAHYEIAKMTLFGGLRLAGWITLILDVLVAVSAVVLSVLAATVRTGRLLLVGRAAVLVVGTGGYVPVALALAAGDRASALSRMTTYNEVVTGVVTLFLVVVAAGTAYLAIADRRAQARWRARRVA